MNTITYSIKSHLDCVESLLHQDQQIHDCGQALIDCLKNGGKLMICGNGGSAADSQHFAAELTGRFETNRKALAAIALSTDTSAITAIGNDFGFDEIFSRQVQALGKFGDCLVGISTSGNSKNVINAVIEAKKLGVKVVTLLGRQGGALKDLSEYSVVVQSDRTARIQECHLLIEHIWCEMIDNNFS